MLANVLRVKPALDGREVHVHVSGEVNLAVFAPYTHEHRNGTRCQNNIGSGKPGEQENAEEWCFALNVDGLLEGGSQIFVQTYH